MESYMRGVTTLHHYERISSRDLGLKELRREKEEVKQELQEEEAKNREHSREERNDENDENRKLTESDRL